jgi:OmpR-family two-component system manganese-sensing response regulator
MPKVLIVEDNLPLATGIKDFLAAQRMVAEHVTTIGRARDFVASSTFDVIILDFNLPDGTGLDLLREMRQKKLQTPVLMLTDRTSIEDKLAGFEEGTDDYLGKPFHLKELLMRIQALLRRPQQKLETHLSYKDIELDVGARKIKKAGELVHLSPREFALLEFFMKHPGQVFSLDALLERVWPADNESTTETVVATVRRLRKKIDTEGSPTLIKSVFGAGYSLSEE